MIPGSCFGQVMPEAERLIQTYDIAKGLMRDFEIFPHENEEAAILDIDEFERGWPRMLMEDLRYLISAWAGRRSTDTVARGA